MFDFLKTNIKLNCRMAGLQLHNHLITTAWKNIDGGNPVFHEPYTMYDKKTRTCLLLTGYSFILEDENGREQREVVKIYDVSNGHEQDSLMYGWGHMPEVGNGSRKKDEQKIKQENEAMELHQKWIRDFKRGG